MDRPLISVVVPLYNQQRHIRRCLLSILRQTYPHIEIIVVNDGSSDKSLEIVQGLALSDQRIRVINQKNEGVAAARKSGYLGASGEWLIFVDSDDFLPKDSIGALYHAAIEHRVDIVCGNYLRKWGPLKKSSRGFPHDMATKEIRQPELFSSYYLSFFGVNLFPVTMYGKIYRKSIIDLAMSQIDLFLTPRLHMGEDEAFNLLLFPYVSSIFCLEKSIYVYRFGGITSGYNPFLVELLDFGDFRIGLLDKYHYDKGFLTLFIEYTNILVSLVLQGFEYGVWNSNAAMDWLRTELTNRYLIQRMYLYFLHETNIPDKCRLVLNRDVDSIITLAKEKRKQHRLRSSVKRLLWSVSKHEQFLT